jgi:hypothetical protein
VLSSGHPFAAFVTQHRIASHLAALRGPTPTRGRFVFRHPAGRPGVSLFAIAIDSDEAPNARVASQAPKATLAEKPKYRPIFYALIVVATLAGVALNLLRIDVISAPFYTVVINGALRRR